MAKYCGKCGSKLADDEKVCSRCGMRVEDMSISNSEIRQSSHNNKYKKKLKVVASLIIILSIVAIAFNIISEFSGTKGFLRKVMTAYEKYDVDEMISLSSDVYYYGEDNYVEFYFKSILGESFDRIEENVGGDYKITYKITEINSVSEHRKKEILNNLEQVYPKFDISVIKDFAVGNITVTVKNGNKSEKFNLKITMSKEKNKWKLLYIE